jgi:hypothetical protein
MQRRVVLSSGGDQGCTVAEWHWIGHARCEMSPDGVCDVDYA